MRWRRTGASAAVAAALLSGCASASATATAPGVRGHWASCSVGTPAGGGPVRRVPVRAGDGLPGLALPCLSGRSGPMRLANLRGPALINLYASWCGPCRAETPSLERAYRTLGGRVRFVAVATEDGASAALSFIEAAGVSYPAVFDFSGTLLTDLGESVLPVSLLVRADGSVAAIHLGAYSSAAAVEDAVRAAFGRPR